MTTRDFAPPAEIAIKKHKVVITQQDGSVIKGYFCQETPVDLNSIAGNLHSCFREALTTCYLCENDTNLAVDWAQVKAVCFVSSLKGDYEPESARLYAGGPEIPNIWVEVVFHDGEVIEGYVRNSLHHLEDNGFFLRPSTPGSNNRLIYINKVAIMSYRVLGVRMFENE
jgi:hypothetical protein